MTDQVETLEEKLEHANSALNSTQTKCDDLETQLAETKQQLKDVTERKDALQRKLEDALGNVSQLSNQLLEMKLKNTDLSQSVFELKTSNAAMQEKLDVVENSNALSRTEHEFKMSMLQEKLGHLTGEMSTQRSNLDLSQKSGLALATELERMRTSHRDLQVVVEHLKQERYRQEQTKARLIRVYNSIANEEVLTEMIFESINIDVILQNATKSGFLWKKGILFNIHLYFGLFICIGHL